MPAALGMATKRIGKDRDGWLVAFTGTDGQGASSAGLQPQVGLTQRPTPDPLRQAGQVEE
jgi:hypothetical protein